MKPLVKKVHVCLANCPDEHVDANARAAIAAVRMGMGFERDLMTKWEQCLITCPTCDDGWHVRCAYYAQRPFGCPDCTEDAERAAEWSDWIASPFATQTPDQWKQSAQRRIKAMAAKAPEEDRGRLYALGSKKVWDKYDFERARGYLRPADDTLLTESGPDVVEDGAIDE